MEMREDVLREALLRNSEETERWESYRKEHETAAENLKEFSKHLTVNVMVPIGRKALMRGQLIHTNELLVGHFQGYFSKCSASKATEICELRLRTAKDRLKKLQTEADLWQNKLEKPYVEGVLPSADEHEIIEEYDEEQEKRWREKHKISLKRAKLDEKNQRMKEDRHQVVESALLEEQKNGEDIIKMLEEAELMEELENELEKMDVEEVSDETIRKLMSGEMELPKNKERIAHDPKVELKASETSLTGVIKKSLAEKTVEKPPATNNNTCANPEMQVVNDENTNAIDDDDLTDEVRLIRNQAKFLSPTDQAGFYEYQVEIIRNKVAKIRLTKKSDIEEKVHLLTVQAELEDLMALAEEETEKIESENEINNDCNEKPMEKPEQKRRISFAAEDETLIFRKSEAVSQMLKKITTADDKASQRDIVKLDDCFLPSSTNTTKRYSTSDKKLSILEKVENNYKYIMEHQSEKDCDLVTKIIDEADTTPRTIYITFTHSDQRQNDTEIASTNIFDASSEESFIPGKPSDFYDLYLSQQQKLNEQQLEIVYVNSYIGEESVKAPILKEEHRQIAYEDPRAKFSDPKKATMPILRNKQAVEQEIHRKNANSSKKQTKKNPTFDEDEYLSAYYKVMNDVIEKPLAEPEPLPQEKFIDAHTPKKRVSRFKQMRSEITEKT